MVEGTLNHILEGTFVSHILAKQDFYPYFRDKEDAITAFHLFDKDGNGDSESKLVDSQ